MRDPPTRQVWTPPMLGIQAAGDQFQLQFQVPSYGPQPWSTSLCDCSQDCGNCCLTCCCCCVTFGRIAEIVDKGSTSCVGRGAVYALLEAMCCHWLCSGAYRTKLRAEYSLAESPCGDCCVHLCCEPCALCQEYRQLKNRGFDVTLGWQANMEGRARAAAAKAPPTIPRVMYR